MPELVAATPAIALEGLAVGVDNLRHDVSLSPRFVDAARAQIMRLIVRHGELEGLLAAEAPQKSQGPSWLRNAATASRSRVNSPLDPSDWKTLLAELHLSALNRAKKDENISIDLLARLAVTKFLRTEMSQQFAQVLERCRVLLKNYEGMRQSKAVSIASAWPPSRCGRKSFCARPGKNYLKLCGLSKRKRWRAPGGRFSESENGRNPASAALTQSRAVSESPGCFPRTAATTICAPSIT